ncbi:glycosyltransferase [bacterium]|nr:glycosyltransferase [bacterium]
MIFAHRQIDSLSQEHVESYKFYLRSRTSLRYLLMARAEAREIISIFQPDLIHAHYGTTTGLFATTLGTKPVVITFRGSDLAYPSEIGWSLRRMTGFLISQLGALFADGHICVSKHLTKRIWFKKDHRSIIPSGVDIEFFKPQEPISARRELGWKVNEAVILFHATPLNSKLKRLSLAQKVVSSLSRDGHSVRLEILNGNTSPEKIPLIMNASNVLLLLSRSEGSPNVVREALSCNLPVIATRVGDVEFWLKDLGNCLITKPNIDQIKIATIPLIADIKRCHGRILSPQFSRDKTALSLTNFYKEIVGDAV